MKNKAIAVLVGIVMLLAALPLFVAATPVSPSPSPSGPEKVESVRLFITVPKPGDKITFINVTTSTPGVNVGSGYWTQTKSEAFNGLRTVGTFSRGIYYLIVPVTPKEGYSTFSTRDYTLNGVKNIEGRSSNRGFVFPVQIGEGTLIKEIGLTLKGPNPGDPTGSPKITVSTSRAIVEKCFFAADRNSTHPASGVIESDKTYYLNVLFRAKNGYFFDDDATLFDFDHTNAHIGSGKSVTVYEEKGQSYLKFVVPLETRTPPFYPFTDTNGYAWYTAGIKYCYVFELMNGVSKTSFRPNSPLTRAMFVTILAKLDGADTSEYKESVFEDVPAGKWYTAPIGWAYANRYTSGTGHGLFSPDAPVTRQQLAQFLYTYTRSKGYPESDPADLDKYTDKDAVRPWAVDAVKWAVAEGLISGTSATTLSPDMAATRAQVATIIMNYREYSLGKPEIITNLDLTFELPKAGDVADEIVFEGLPEHCSVENFAWNHRWGGDYPIITLEEGSSYLYCVALKLDGRYAFDPVNTTVTVNGEAPYEYDIKYIYVEKEGISNITVPTTLGRLTLVIKIDL